MGGIYLSRNYLKKSIIFLCLIGFIAIGVVGGCSNNGGQNSTQALTENDFSNDPSIQANLERHVVIKFLEHPDSDTPENDTGEIGNDIIPLRYDRTAEHTYCWEDDDGGAGHFLELDDSEGNEILRIDVNGECKTVLLEAGNYVMTLHHDGRIETTHPIFIIPNPENIVIGENKPGLFNRFKQAAAHIVQGIQKTVTKDAQAQENRQVEILLRTNRCPACDIPGVDLSGADLKGAFLVAANMTGTNLTSTNLMGADMRGSILVDANMRFANLSEALLGVADLTGADMTGADLTDADCLRADMEASILVNANMSGADMSQVELGLADLMGANLTGADLTVAQLVEANLENAILQDADIRGALLEMAIIVNANLRNALLFSADFPGADLSGSDFTDADMRITDLSSTNLTGSNLMGADMRLSNLDNANLSFANLSFADLSDGQLVNANLTGAILFGADFKFALWCNGCTCDIPSIGTCVGCPPADEVCTGS